MKRLRDDFDDQSPIKRPFGSSRGEPYAQPLTGGAVGEGEEKGVGGPWLGSGGGTQKPTTNDALTYLKQVREFFHGKKEKYETFLEVMKSFRDHRIDATDVVTKVKKLFKGHNHLIYGFNTFLPKGSEITPIDKEEAPSRRATELEEAMSFVNRIKQCFQNDDSIYRSFLDTLNMFRKGQKNIVEVYSEVASLFEGHPDLLKEFGKFMPDVSATAPLASFGQSSLHRFDESTPGMPLREKQFDKQRLRRDRIISSHDEHDLKIQCHNVNDVQNLMVSNKEQRKQSERQSRDRPNRITSDHHLIEQEQEDNTKCNACCVSNLKKSVLRIEEFGGSSGLASYDDRDTMKRKYNREFGFCEKVKDRLSSPDDYQTFLKYLHIYSKKIISRNDLQNLIADLLGSFPDLMKEFNNFLEYFEGADGFFSDMIGKSIESKSMKVDKDKEQKREMDGIRDMDKLKEKYWGKSIQDLDLSNCRSCTPSYRFLPEDYPIPSVSERSKLGSEVLNDHLVSATSGSEDFKHMHRNQFEEAMFRCEDDRFELDMLLESASSTIKCVEKLLNSVNHNVVNIDSPICLEDYCTASNLRVIERVYGDHGLEAVDILRKRPSTALPVILARLKQKQEEWTKSRLQFNTFWAEIYAKNHDKSLDQRSSSFKQQDPKNFSAKALLAEIKESMEKWQNENDVVLSVAAGRRHPMGPSLKYEYDDTEVHEDLYRLVLHSCKEVYTNKEQFDKVMRLWTAFLEPMLGIPSTRHGYEVAVSSFHSSETVCRGGEESRQINSDVKLALGYTINGRISAEVTPGHGASSSRRGDNSNDSDQGDRSIIINFPSLEDRGKLRSDHLSNRRATEETKFNRLVEDIIGSAKLEKDVGEFCPDDNIRKHSVVVYGNGVAQAIANCPSAIKFPTSNGTGIHKTHSGGENDASAHNGVVENMSETDEDVSGSESATDECSREEHEIDEDREYDELDGKTESESEVQGLADGHLVKDSTSIPCSGDTLLKSKPLTKHLTSALPDDRKKGSRIFYGNDKFYVLLRLHQILYGRLRLAKLNSASAEMKWKAGNDACHPNLYARFMSALHDLLDGSIDNSKYEDDCRAIFGNQSYVLFTLDKLIYKLVKHLQIVAGDEIDCKLLKLFKYENSRKPEKFVDAVYYENFHVFLQDEDIYRFECSSCPRRLSIQLIEEGFAKSDEVEVSIDSRFARYMQKNFLTGTPINRESSNIMLRRNKRKYADLQESSAICMAMEGVHMVNRLEHKMSCNSFKISFVHDTEDYFIRSRLPKSHSRKLSFRREKVEREKKFHSFLSR